jgi:hypothetical protein
LNTLLCTVRVSSGALAAAAGAAVDFSAAVPAAAISYSD